MLKTYYLLLAALFIPLCTSTELTSFINILEEWTKDDRVVNGADAAALSQQVLHALLQELVMDDDGENATCGSDWSTLGEFQQKEKVIGDIAIPASKQAIAIDSFGKPEAGILRGNTKLMGSFDECLSIETHKLNFSMKYCQLPITVIVLIEGTHVPFTFTEAICVPESCSLKDFNGSLPLINEILSIIPMAVIMSDMTTCTVQGPTRYNAGAVIMIMISLLFVILTFAATLFDLIYLQYYRSRSDGKLSEVASDEDEKQEATPLLPKAKPSRAHIFLLDAIEGFSLYKTLPAVLSTKQPPSAITSINGIRVISMFWVIMCHAYFFMFELQNFSNTFDVMTGFVTRFSSQPILNGFFSVDSFFFLSGLLVAYLTFRQMKRNNGRFPYLPFYIHRFLRLTPTYMFVLFFYWFVTAHLGSGPLLDAAIGPDSDGAKYCRKYWWTNLLYINNFYPTKFGEQCMGWAWYLANDMQFYIVSPLLLIPLYYFLPGGLIAMGVVLITSFSVTGALAGYYNYPANGFWPMIDQSATPPPGQPDQSSQIYGKPYCRITPYIVGLLLGYIFFKNYKIPVKKGVLGWTIHLFIWLVAFVLGVVNVYGLYFTWHGHEFSQGENVSYFMFSRFTWGVTLFLVVYVCHHGYGGFVNRFLSLPIWIPLGRLTFNAYLVHEMVMLLMFSDLRNTLYYTDASFIFYIIGMVVLSYGAAGVVSVFVEFPLSNLESAVFSFFGAPLRPSSRIINRGKEYDTVPHKNT